jgi:uncharacterized GH25 family protein
MNKPTLSALLVAALSCAPFLVGAAHAHDTWVQTNTNVVRSGDATHIDLMLGNHGNDHRDFKLAGKTSLEGAMLQVIAPGGARTDIKPKLVDTGYEETEGFWTAPYVAAKPGLYLVAHTADQVMTYAPVRSVKSAKTCFVVSKTLDRVPVQNPGFDRVLGHPLELVPETNPVTPMGPGTPLTVRLLWKGKPLPNGKVTFIPRGATLKTGNDARYDRVTNVNGRTSFEPKSANYYLVVAHWTDNTAKGKGYDSTKYSAALTVYVPQICPCCG